MSVVSMGQPVSSFPAWLSGPGFFADLLSFDSAFAGCFPTNDCIGPVNGAAGVGFTGPIVGLVSLSEPVPLFVTEQTAGRSM